MTPWILLDTAAVPDDGGALRLLQRGAEFSIRLGHNELMNSRIHGSEEALAEIACARIARRSKPRILIGGLGMGFTLRAALDELSPDARVVVAELVPAVVAWNRAALAHLSGHALDDARVAIRLGDVGEAIRAVQAAYDAILLDVDNGPEGLSRGPTTDSTTDGGWPPPVRRSARVASWRCGRRERTQSSPGASARRASPWRKSACAPGVPAAAPVTSSGSRRVPQAGVDRQR